MPPYRPQRANLPGPSPFYRETLETAGFGTPARTGGLSEIARLPFKEKSELRATCSATTRSARIWPRRFAPRWSFAAAVDLVPWGTLQRREYKTKLVQR